MKRTMSFLASVVCSCFFSITAIAGTVGDINCDGKIDLTEAIYALQVSSGAYPSLPSEKDRYVVISHPYDSEGGHSNEYELLILSSSGVLSSSGKSFEMGRATAGDMVFTPDGKIGIVAQDDGTLGVFRIDSEGNPQVVHTAFTGSFFAGNLMMHSSGDYIYLLDPQWASVGGGVYKVEIGSDGHLTDKGRIIEAKLPYAIIPLPGKDGQAVIAAKNLLNSEGDDDIHLVTLDPEITRLSSANVFDDNEQIISSASITYDGKYVLFGDNNSFSGIPNRVAVAQIDGNSLVYRQMLTPIDDPTEILTSPYNNSAIVVSTLSDAIYTFSYTPTNVLSPFSSEGELSYVGETPSLPSSSVIIDCGNLYGRALIAESNAIRMLQFTPAGEIIDLGPWVTGTNYESIVGIIGIQP